MAELLSGTQLKSVLMTFFISMVPVLELRGAVPFAVAQGLPVVLSVIISILGNMVPVPFIIIFIRRIFIWIRRKIPVLENLVTKLENRTMSKKDMIIKYEMLGLIIIVAIPLPGTGAWTGAMLAGLMDMRLKKAVPMIFIGVVLAGIIVGCISAGVLTLFS